MSKESAAAIIKELINRDMLRQFQKIKQLVNVATRELFLRRNDSPWSTEPVNWADFKCAAVEYVIDDSGGEFYRAIIEEAAPGCRHVIEFVTEHLKQHGYDDVEVVMEW